MNTNREVSVVSDHFIPNGFTTSDSGNFISDALESIKIHFLEYDSKSYKRCSFSPNMAHQIFGKDELIFGYSNLNIDITYCGISGHALLKYSYSSKVEDKVLIAADNIHGKIKEWIPNIYTSKQKFEKMLRTITHTTGYGRILLNFNISKDNRIFKCSINLCDLSDKQFVQFHKRYQSLIVFFIDAASYINLTDKNWTILYLYLEKSVDGKAIRLPIGFLTIYKFVTPKITRSRISQVFIIPPYQRLGLGTKLLETAYEFINGLGDVDEITVESPSAEFTKLRDNYDLKLLTALPEFCKRNVLKGYSPKMGEVARKLFKINRTQCIHLYYILKYHYGNNFENSVGSEKVYKDLRKRFKASYAVQCKRRIAKTMKNLVCIKTLIEDFDVDRKLREYLFNLAPTLKYLSNLSKKKL